MPEFSIIIPAYNEEKAIKKVISDLKELPENYELIVVDDGSSDKTYEIAVSTGARVIKHLHNKGYGAALKTGIRNARANVVIFFDADGQHNQKDIQRLAGDIQDYDMVVGARDEESYKSYLRLPGKKMLALVANYLAETKIPDLNSGFRAIRKNIVNRFIHILPNTFSFTTTITLAFLKSGYEIKYIPITTDKRLGKSTVKVRDGFRMFILILRMIMLFDPLKVFLPPSLFLLGVGAIFILYTLLTEYVIWKSGILLVFSGITIFFFGLLADQMANIRREIGKEE